MLVSLALLWVGAAGAVRPPADYRAVVTGAAAAVTP